MFTSAGPDTLAEYRRAWSGIDSYLHGFGLIDMHDLGDTMMASGFAAPVLDRDNLTIDYPDIDALQAELVALGAANLAQGRRTGLMSKEVRQKLRDNIAPGDRFAVSLELVQEIIFIVACLYLTLRRLSRCCRFSRFVTLMLALIVFIDAAFYVEFSG